MEGESNGRISVSEDKLYRALAETRIQIETSFREAIKEEVSPLESRVTSLEHTRAGLMTLETRSEAQADRRALVRPVLFSTVTSALVSFLITLLPHHP